MPPAGGATPLKAPRAFTALALVLLVLPGVVAGWVRGQMSAVGWLLYAIISFGLMTLLLALLVSGLGFGALAVGLMELFGLLGGAVNDHRLRLKVAAAHRHAHAVINWMRDPALAASVGFRLQDQAKPAGTTRPRAKAVIQDHPREWSMSEDTWVICTIDFALFKGGV